MFLVDTDTINQSLELNALKSSKINNIVRKYINLQ